MENKKIILPENVVLTAEVKTLYKDEMGKYYLNEIGARQKLATHYKCECGNGIREKFRIHCDSCEPVPKVYFKEWDQKTPVYCSGNDQYFFDLESLEEYMADNELTPDDMNLYLCEPSYLSEVTSDYWEDVLPEDGDIPKDVELKLSELNEAIIIYNKTTPISWSPSKYKTKYLPIITNE